MVATRGRVGAKDVAEVGGLQEGLGRLSRLGDLSGEVARRAQLGREEQAELELARVERLVGEAECRAEQAAVVDWLRGGRASDWGAWVRGGAHTEAGLWIRNGVRQLEEGEG